MRKPFIVISVVIITLILSQLVSAGLLSYLVGEVITGRVITAAPITPTTCTDSDSGKNYFTRGTTTQCSNTITPITESTDSNAEGNCLIRTDSCKDTTYTVEYFCDGNTFGMQTYACPKGCSNGVCNECRQSSDCPQLDCSISSYCPTLTCVNGKCVSCVSAGGAGPNPSLGPNDPNRGRTCCAGLDMISLSSVVGDNLCNTLVGAGTICSDCGNGVCEKWENKCNCAEDCSAGTCKDSDGGKIYNVKGYSIGVTGVRWDDNCNPNDGKLTETYCNGENVNFISYACPNGCKDGACIQGPVVCTTEYAPVCGQPPTPICSGEVCSIGAIQQPKTYGNMCLLNSAGATFLYSGQCRVNTCTDTDGGKNYDLKGTARTSDDVSKTDYCTVASETDAGKYLTEYYCDGAVIRNSGYDCPNGCSDGACVKTTPDSCVFPTGFGCSNLRACSSSQEVEFTLYNRMGQGIIISDFELSGCYMKSISEIGGIPNGGSIRIVEKCSGLVAGKQTNRSYTLKYYASDSTAAFEKTLSGQIFVTPGPCLSQTCTDTDGGKIYDVRGTCSDGNLNIVDSCNPNVPGRINEAFCSNNACNFVAYDNVCPNGCVDGACVKNTADIPLTLAVDDASPASDVAMLVKLGTRLEGYGYKALPGKLFSDVDTSQLDNKVTVAIYYGEAITIVGSHSPTEHVLLTIKINDILSDEMNASVQPAILSEAVTVSNLRYLFNAKCTDTDGGKNYNVPGVTSTDTLKSADYCAANVNKNRLYEFYCADGELKSIGYNCPNGCANGACIPSEPPVIPCSSAGQPGPNPSLGPNDPIGMTCCAGLDMISRASVAASGLCMMSVGAGTICSDCGNGICEAWENNCNCEEDCQSAPICTDKCGDGVCATVVCTGTGCACAENPTNCPADCAEETCTDTDGGLNYYVLGTAKGVFGGTISTMQDSCCVIASGGGSSGASSAGDETSSSYYCSRAEGTRLNEVYCEAGYIRTQHYSCEYGCLNGACKTGLPVIECEGCLQGTRCIPYGTRLGSTDSINYPSYCNINGEFARQNSDGASCQNSYECVSNYCTGGKCINLEEQTKETQNMLKQILSLFKKIFG